MATGSYLSIITLNVNGLNAPTKRQRLTEWIQKQAKAERIQHHQTSSSTNAKGSSLDRKQKRLINSNPKQQSKWQWAHTYQ